MEEFFIIRKTKLDKSWNLSDLHQPNNALDYCEQMLDIPEEHILDASMSPLGLEVTVVVEDIDEDWYRQLLRVA